MERKLEIVEVTWRDIITDSGWLNEDEVDDSVMDKEVTLVKQVGYLYEEDEDQICLLNSHFPHSDMFGDLTRIPKGVVIKIEKWGK